MVATVSPVSLSVLHQASVGDDALINTVAPMIVVSNCQRDKRERLCRYVTRPAGGIGEAFGDNLQLKYRLPAQAAPPRHVSATALSMSY